MRGSDRTRQQLIGHLLDASAVFDVSHSDAINSIDFASRALRLCSPADRSLADRAQYQIDQLLQGAN